ncbi:unnamed protein product, partial [Choristocarpus tenellus]
GTQWRRARSLYLPGSTRHNTLPDRYGFGLLAIALRKNLPHKAPLSIDSSGRSLRHLMPNVLSRERRPACCKEDYFPGQCTPRSLTA